MLSILFYLVLIGGLVVWVEGTNSLIIKRNPAEDLEAWLKKFRWNTQQELKACPALPQYKFYSEIIEILLGLARRMGGNYQDSLLFLRAGLQIDRQSEKKLRELNLGCWLQMLMIIFLTWAFILGALSLVEVKVAPFKLILLALWQAIGLTLLPCLLRYFRGKYFGDIGKLWKMLFILNSLVKVPLSRSEVFTMAQVQDLKHIKQKSLFHIVDKLKDICHKTLKQGGSYEEEVKYLMEELRFQEKWHFDLFEKRLTVIKLALLAVFFLPSYMAFIFFLLGDLMAMM